MMSYATKSNDPDYIDRMFFQNEVFSNPDVFESLERNKDIETITNTMYGERGINEVHDKLIVFDRMETSPLYNIGIRLVDSVRKTVNPRYTRDTLATIYKHQRRNLSTVTMSLENLLRSFSAIQFEIAEEVEHYANANIRCLETFPSIEEKAHSSLKETEKLKYIIEEMDRETDPIAYMNALKLYSAKKSELTKNSGDLNNTKLADRELYELASKSMASREFIDSLCSSLDAFNLSVSLYGQKLDQDYNLWTLTKSTEQLVTVVSENVLVLDELRSRMNDDYLGAMNSIAEAFERQSQSSMKAFASVEGILSATNKLRRFQAKQMKRNTGQK